MCLIFERNKTLKRRSSSKKLYGHFNSIAIFAVPKKSGKSSLFWTKPTQHTHRIGVVATRQNSLERAQLTNFG